MEEQMVEDQILELENGSQYVLLDEFDFEGKRYFYTIGYDDENGYDENDYLFFEHGFDENKEEYVEKIEDGNLYKKLLAYELATTFADDPQLRPILEAQIKYEEEGSK